MSKKESEPASTETADDESSNRLTGWRQHCIIASVFMGLFLSFLDTTIVAVVLPTISDQFGDFARSSWVITAYLLTYMAFGIILARLSDFFGSKAIEVTSLVLFLIFSIACAVSQNMFQLIVFRALQGIGGSGLYSMTMVINLRIVSPRKMPLMAAVLSLVQVVSGVLGPVLGGAMAHSRTSDTWRWIFWINLPLGGVALATIMVAWPHEKGKKELAKAALSSIDFLGAFLLLAFSILLVFALVEAGTRAYSWGSAAIIVSLVLSGLSLVAFVAWQEILTRRPTWPVEGIFPLEVVKMRVMGSTILVTLLTGFVFYIAVVHIPERFQIVSGDNAVIAGVKFLPMMAGSAVGSFVAGAVNQRRNLTSPIIVIATALQVLGYGLMSSLEDDIGTPKAIYGYQVLVGLGFGLCIASATIMVQINLTSRPQFMAATQGALTQVRSLGGSIGLAIAVIVLNAEVRSSAVLTDALSSDQLDALYRSPLVIETFSVTQQSLVAHIHAHAFVQQMRVATYIIAAGFLVSLLALESKPVQPAIRQQSNEETAPTQEVTTAQRSEESSASEK